MGTAGTCRDCAAVLFARAPAWRPDDASEQASAVNAPAHHQSADAPSPPARRPVATLPPTLTVDGLGPVTGQAFRNDHGDLTAVVHGYSGVYGIDSRTFTLIRRPSADWERGLVPFRPTKPSAETPQHHPSPPASP